MDEGNAARGGLVSEGRKQTHTVSVRWHQELHLQSPLRTMVLGGGFLFNVIPTAALPAKSIPTKRDRGGGGRRVSVAVHRVTGRAQATIFLPVPVTRRAAANSSCPPRGPGLCWHRFATNRSVHGVCACVCVRVCVCARVQRVSALSCSLRLPQLFLFSSSKYAKYSILRILLTSPHFPFYLSIY